MRKIKTMFTEGMGVTILSVPYKPDPGFVPDVVAGWEGDVMLLRSGKRIEQVQPLIEWWVSGTIDNDPYVAALRGPAAIRIKLPADCNRAP